MQPSKEVNIGKDFDTSGKIKYQLGDEVLSDRAPGSNKSVKSNNTDILNTDPNPNKANASYLTT